MGWGNCGTDSKGRPIGYIFKAKCDHPECNKNIDRGLSYACGGMHGTAEFGCEKYFCCEHLNNTVLSDGDYINICGECAKSIIESGDMHLDEDEGVIVHKKE